MTLSLTVAIKSDSNASDMRSTTMSGDAESIEGLSIANGWHTTPSDSLSIATDREARPSDSLSISIQKRPIAK